ncbi:MAG: 3-oxo-tetronate kinase [Succinivibrio sp.]
MKIGVIADDFTGATDIASFLVKYGLPTIQATSPEAVASCPDCEALVVSGKTRSCPPEEAVGYALRACRALKSRGCQRFFFKYCSTFDSTREGNIGPVTDALMRELGARITVVSPALPVNGRTVYKGYLFVGDGLLEESGMRNHPITPMRDSSLKRLMEAQSSGKCGIIDLQCVRKGPEAISSMLLKLEGEGFSYAAADAIEECDLMAQGRAFIGLPLVTGGSGLGAGLAAALRDPDSDPSSGLAKGMPRGGKAVVLSGSCSVMTNRQVGRYRAKASSLEVDVPRLMGSDDGARQCVEEARQFVKSHCSENLAPMVYATADPRTLSEIQQRFGAPQSARAIEGFFAALSKALLGDGFERFIVAGGETSGIVAKSLGVEGFYIGPSVAPGVPWVRSTSSPVSLILKSGNFGDEDFFEKSQEVSSK